MFVTTFELCVRVVSRCNAATMDRTLLHTHVLSVSLACSMLATTEFSECKKPYKKWWKLNIHLSLLLLLLKLLPKGTMAIHLAQYLSCLHSLWENLRFAGGRRSVDMLSQIYDEQQKNSDEARFQCIRLIRPSSISIIVCRKGMSISHAHVQVLILVASEWSLVESSVTGFGASVPPLLF